MVAFDSEYVLRRMIESHPEGYSFDKFEYRAMNSKVTVTCDRHGDFQVTPRRFIETAMCPECKQVESDDNWKLKFSQRHGDRLTVLGFSGNQINGLRMVRLRCIHGEFETYQGNAKAPKFVGCGRCAGDVRRVAMVPLIIPRFREVHGDRYDYSEFEYKGMLEKATVICTKHGPFSVTPANHESKGSGCSSCTSNASSKEEILWMDAIQLELGEVITRGHRFGNEVREVDGVIGNVIIEYDGAYWHHSEENHARDELKVSKLNAQGFSVVRLRAKSAKFELRPIPGAVNYYVPERGIDEEVVKAVTNQIRKALK